MKNHETLRSDTVRWLWVRKWGSALFALLSTLACVTAGQAAELTAPTNAVTRLSDAANDPEAIARIEALVKAANSGEQTAQKAYEAAELGMSALWAAAARMDPDKPSHRGPLLLMAEQAAHARKTQRELLHLYDPPAYRAFYTPEGTRMQAWLAGALKWNPAPPNMPRAMVLAAPDPTIAWLEAQDAQTLKTPGLLMDLLREWGALVSMGREPQYGPRLQSVAKRLADDLPVPTDEALLRAILQFIGDVECRDSADFAAASLGHPTAAVRCVAAATLGRLRDDSSLQALTDRAEREADPAAQIAIADALGQWPKAPEAGDACLRLYTHTTNAAVRRAVLNAAAAAEWSTREPLVRRSFEAGEGFALIALATKPVPALDAALLDRLKNHEGPFLDPYLFDAVVTARPEGAVPLIANLLRQERNIAVRLKYVSALETLGGNAAGATLLKLLETSREELEIDHAVSSLGRLRYEPAVPRLARIAKDAGVEIGIRVQAVWALGRMPNDQAKTELDEIERDLARTNDVQFASVNTAFHARLVAPHLLLAQLRFDRASADEKIEGMFNEGWPIRQAALLAGLAEQQIDHPIIAAGLDSRDFAVFYMAITAARAANPAKYGPRIRRLAMSPYVQALEQVSLETWDLKNLLTEGWR